MRRTLAAALLALALAEAARGTGGAQCAGDACMADVEELDGLLQKEVAMAEEERRKAKEEEDVAAARERFDELDANGDGAVEVDELWDAVRANAGAAGTGRADVAGFMAMGDADMDQRLTFDEYRVIIRARRT